MSMFLISKIKSKNKSAIVMEKKFIKRIKWKREIQKKTLFGIIS